MCKDHWSWEGVDGHLIQPSALQKKKTELQRARAKKGETLLLLYFQSLCKLNITLKHSLLSDAFPFSSLKIPCKHHHAPQVHSCPLGCLLREVTCPSPPFSQWILSDIYYLIFKNTQPDMYLKYLVNTNQNSVDQRVEMRLVSTEPFLEIQRRKSKVVSGWDK